MPVTSLAGKGLGWMQVTYMGQGMTLVVDTIEAVTAMPMNVPTVSYSGQLYFAQRSEEDHLEYVSIGKYGVCDAPEGVFNAWNKEVKKKEKR